jgi:hypothetical protein
MRSVMRYIIAASAVIVVFLALCFYTPTQAPRYRLMADPDWYKLDTRGIER